MTPTPTLHLGTWATLTVDGNPSDWAGIPALLTDPSGDAGGNPDLLSIKVANDAHFVYFLLQYANQTGIFPYLFLNTDLNPATGCTDSSLFGFALGFEHVLAFVLPAGGGLTDSRDCIGGFNDFPGALVYVVAGNFIEASVSINTLKTFAPNLTAFDMAAGNDTSVLVRYQLATTGNGGGNALPGDVNQDGHVTPADALCVFRRFLGLPSCLD